MTGEINKNLKQPVVLVNLNDLFIETRGGFLMTQPKVPYRVSIIYETLCIFLVKKNVTTQYRTRYFIQNF